MKPSVFTLIFRDFTLEEAIPAIAGIGYQGVELMGRPPHLPPDTPPARVREIKRLIDDHGLVVADIAGYAGNYSQANDAQAQLDDLARQLEMADLLGCKLIRHHAGGPSYDQATEAQWQRAVEGMQTAADLASRAGVRLVNELHPNGLVETADSAVDFLRRVDRPNVGVVFDPGNGYRGFLSCECEIRWPGKEAVLLCAEHEYRVLTQLIGQAAG